jgi:UDP-N-acetylmuramate dehydrogenase
MTDAYTLLHDAPLRELNTLRITAAARWLATLDDPSRLPDVLGRSEFLGSPVLVLGQGSNVLFARDFDGLVLQPAWRRVSIADDRDDGVRVRAEAGLGWDALVDWTLAQQLTGLENLALIPGLVGAAPIQNIGAYGAEVSELILSVEAWDRRDSTPALLPCADCRFGYRDSLFKQEPDRWIVTAVNFLFPRDRELKLGYAGLRELPDPEFLPNAGSFFKNPAVPAGLAGELAAKHPGLPVHESSDGRCKLSAAWMIEACGLKGIREGDAGVSAQHALVLVNHGSASGAELLGLARRVADSVEQRFGIRLEPEPRIVGASFQ